MRRALRILVIAHGWWAGPLLAVLITVQFAVTGPADAAARDHLELPEPHRPVASAATAHVPAWSPIYPAASSITDTMARRIAFQLTARDHLGHVPVGGDADPALWCQALAPWEPAHIADMVVHTQDWRAGQLIVLAIETTCPELAPTAATVRDVLAGWGRQVTADA